VDGATVEERIEQDGPFDERLALYVTREVAKALVYLHRRGVIHRDLKPGNFLLTEAGEVKIIDLGLAKLAAGMTKDSDPGLTVGTVEYLSPEQARGLEDVDGRSDIYSLGVSLFHMMVGEVPFKGESNQEVIAKQVLQALESPKLKSRSVSAYTHYFIQRMMAKDRRDRFQTPEEIVTEIEDKAGDVSDAIPRSPPRLSPRSSPDRKSGGRRASSGSRRRKKGRRDSGRGRRR
jgi:serine/threonine-protein kinase